MSRFNPPVTDGYVYSGGAVSYRAGLGALSSVNDFETIAKAAAAKSASSFLIVFVHADGQTELSTFASRSALLNTWDDKVAGKLSGDMAFALMVDKTRNPIGEGAEYDQTVNQQIQTQTITKVNWKGIAPWVVGGVAVIAAAIFMSGGAPSKAKRRRRRPSYRRRTVTVWR